MIAQADAAIINDAIRLRRDLHRQPELLYDLPRTSAVVTRRLNEVGCDQVVPGLGETGVVAVINGRGTGRSIGLRADMDALPIDEETGAEWASEVPGLMHACGHDGHTAALLAAAAILAHRREFSGRVVLIFQPAEEGGAGARRMMDDGLFTRFDVDEVYALHNCPGMEIGRFGVTPGFAMASVDKIDITIEGRGGHAADPHLAADPLPALGALIQAVQGIVARSVSPLSNAVLSLCEVSGGQAFNVIPTTLRLSGTVRALDPKVQDLIERRLTEMCQGLAIAMGVDVRLDYARTYPVLRNWDAKVAHATAAAELAVGADRVDANHPPALAGEDFAFMLAEKPGALTWFGNGSSAPLHNPKYDFADEALRHAVAFWLALVAQRCGTSEETY